MYTAWILSTNLWLTQYTPIQCISTSIEMLFQADLTLSLFRLRTLRMEAPVWTWKVHFLCSLLWFKHQLNVNFRSMYWTSPMHFFVTTSCNWPLVPSSDWCFFTQTLCLHWVVYHIFSSPEGSKFQVIQGFTLDGSGRAPCKHYSCFPYSLKHPALPKIRSTSSCLMVIEQCPWKRHIFLCKLILR